MSYFEKAFENTLGNEGGYVNHPNDPGGPTNFGISLRTLKALGDLEFDFDDDGDIDIEDIKNLTPETAREFYKKHWWLKYDFDEITNEYSAMKLFDMSIWMGQSRAVKIYQTALNFLKIPVAIDGIMGPQTIKNINHYGTVKMFNDLIRKGCQKFLIGLINRNPKLEYAKKNWLKRAAY